VSIGIGFVPYSPLGRGFEKNRGAVERIKAIDRSA
jgi:aryl-alcohol dehydrogenase-like predicted oxidoreductase